MSTFTPLRKFRTCPYQRRNVPIHQVMRRKQLEIYLFIWLLFHYPHFHAHFAQEIWKIKFNKINSPGASWSLGLSQSTISASLLDSSWPPTGSPTNLWLSWDASLWAGLAMPLVVSVKGKSSVSSNLIFFGASCDVCISMSRKKEKVQ